MGDCTFSLTWIIVILIISNNAETREALTLRCLENL